MLFCSGMARANLGLGAPMCAPPQPRDLQENQKALAKMDLTALTQLRQFGSSAFGICTLQFLTIILLLLNIISQRQGQALHPPSYQMDVEWLFERGSSHKYSRHPHQQQKRLDQKHWPGKVGKDFGLTHCQLLSLSKAQSQGILGLPVLKKPGPPTRSPEVLFQKWSGFASCKDKSLKYLRKKHASSRAHNSVLMGLLRQILQQLSSFFPFHLQVNGRATKF